MANTNPIMQAMMNKIARDAQIMGLTVVSQGYNASGANIGNPNVVISNGSNNLTISYAAAVFNPSVVGGIDATVSPFLGIGTANPGQLTLQSASGTTVPTLIDGATAAQVLANLAGRANDIIMYSSDGSTQIAYLRGSSDLLGQGQ